MKALNVLLFLSIFVMATIVACEIWPVARVLPVVGLVTVYLLGCIVNVQPKTGVVAVNLFGGMRELTAGWQFIFRPFEWLGAVNGAREHSLQNRVLDVKLDVESEDEEILTLDLSINFKIASLVRFLDFSLEDFKESVREHAKALASERSRLCKDRDEIMDQKAAIEEHIHRGFQKKLLGGKTTLEDYHGIYIDTVVISDPELPEDLKKAEVEREIAEKRMEALETELKMIKRLAQLLVAQSKRNGKEMSLEKAMELIQLQLGKASKEIKQFSLDGDASGLQGAALLDFLTKGGNKGKGGGHNVGGKKGGP